MPVNREYPQYDPAEVKQWLTKVFGKEIIFESQDSQGWGKRDSQADPCAWQLYYTGQIYLRMDLPPLIAPYFASSLKNALASAMEDQIDPDWRLYKDKWERRQKLREAGWVLPSEVIDDNLSIDTEKLRTLAGRLNKPAQWTGSVVSKMLTHEAAWIERKKSVASICDELFLGQTTPSDRRRFGFGYGAGREGVELILLLSSYSPPLPNGDVYEEERKWRKHNHDLGLEGMLAYQYYHEGTHAPIDDFKLALSAVSDTDFSNKLEKLRKPEKLAIVRQYINEVIAATFIHNWFDHADHPDYDKDLRTIFDSLPEGLSRDEQISWRTNQMDAIKATPKYTVWDKVFPELAEAHLTTGDFVQAIYREPSAGQEELYARLRRWAEETFPLLKTHLDAIATPIGQIALASQLSRNDLARKGMAP